MRRTITVAVLVASILFAACNGQSDTTASSAQTSTTGLMSLPAGQEDWPSYGRDHDNSRLQASEDTLTVESVAGLKVRWRIDELGGVTGTAAIVGGVVFFGDWNGWLWAVDASDGSELWKKRVTEDQISASVAVGETLVYAADLAGVVHAVDRFSGEEVWSVAAAEDPGTGHFSSPVLVDNLVIIGVSASVGAPRDYRGSVVALDAGTGEEVWRFRTNLDEEGAGTGIAVWSSAAIDAERGLMYIGTGNTNTKPHSPYANAVIAIKYATGDLVWVYQFFEADTSDFDVGASPNLFTVDGHDVVGVGAKSGEYAVLDRETGEEIWRVHLAAGSPTGGIMTTAAVEGGVIHVNSNDGGSRESITVALDASDGSTIWEQRLSAGVFGALAVAGGVVYHGTLDGTVYAFSADDGSILWSEELDVQIGGGLSISEGVLYVGTGFGWPFAFEPVSNGSLIAYSLP